MFNKNLIPEEGWVNDNFIKCSTCQYAVWGWRYQEHFKQRFVKDCVKSFRERGNHVSIKSMPGIGFNPAICCDGYKEVN